MTPPKSDKSKTGDEPKTKYLVYEAVDGGRTLTLRGIELADSSSDAYRDFFKREENLSTAGAFVAISTNAARIRNRVVEATVKTTIEELEPPESIELPADAPERVVEV